MDTKLKNISYSKVTQVIAVILAWLCVLTAFGSSSYLLSNQDTLKSSNFYESSNFVNEYSRFIHNTIEYHVKLKSEENIKSSSRSEAEIQDKLTRYNIIKERLKGNVNFAYYIKDRNTGQVFTNLNNQNQLSIIESQKSMFHYIHEQIYYEYPIMFWDDIRKMLTGTSYEVYMAVIEPLKQGDKFYDDYVLYKETSLQIGKAIYLLVGSVILLLLLLAYLIYAAGRRNGEKVVVLRKIDRIYFEVHTMMVLVAAVVSLIIAATITNFTDMSKFGRIVAVLIVLSIDFFIGLSFMLSLTRQIKAKNLRKSILFIQVFTKIKMFILKLFNKGITFIKLCFNGKIFKVWILILLLAYTAMNIVVSFSFIQLTLDAKYGYYHGYKHIYYGVFLFALNGFVFYQTAKALRSLSEIMEGTKMISNGNMDYSFDVNNMSVAFAAFAENIQTIYGGMKKAVDEAIKGERMKTDLITNVSHDLKTPLTSIINYVDLLKRENVNNQKAIEYINILDEKSSRLKVLIEDLVEASKASSGNLPVNMEKVDLNVLVMQATGEYREKIEKAGLDIRTSASDKSIFIRADGKHMWRIIENLLSNVLKYSMAKSRVYINITKNETYGVLTIKNISALPLEMPVEQLTERFVRGDVSRTTEGSGLGLSIAQSLTSLQKGRLNIEIDGDLFKVTVEIPSWSN